MMDSYKAIAILVFCALGDAAALPQPQLPGLAPIPTGRPAGLSLPALPVPLPALPVPLPGLPGLPLPIPGPAGGLPGLPIPSGGASGPKLPIVGNLPLPIPDLPVPLPDLPVPDVDLTELTSSPAGLTKLVDLGTTVLSIILDILSKGASITKGAGGLPALPVPVKAPLQKRQATTAGAGPAAATAAATAAPAAATAAPAGGLLGGLTSNLPLVGGLTSNLPLVGGGANPLSGVVGTVTNAVGGVPVVGGAAAPVLNAVGGLAGGAGGAAGPLGAVTGTLGGLTGGAGGAAGPLGAVTGTLGGLTGGAGGAAGPLGAVTGTLGGLTGGAGGAAGPLGAVTGALGGVTGTVAGAANSIPVAGPVVGGLVNSVAGGTSPLSGVAGTVAGVANSVPVVGPVVGGLVNSLPVVGGGSASTVNPAVLNPAPLTGIPGSDPVGAFSISVIATLLSLLKKDPLALFGPALPIPRLVKRDLPELHNAGIPELAKRQLSLLPSLSTGIPGIGVGGLPLSGVPGVPPDLAFLVGSIAKNIAVPGGNGLGSITGNILSVLNGVVPNFLFQLPVVQDSVPTFGVLQLLSSINPAKFGSLAGLNSLSTLSQAASTIPAADLAFVKGLPASPDPSNLITTIITLSDNILSLPGNVGNLKAAVSVLCLKNLGLAVPGL